MSRNLRTLKLLLGILGICMYLCIFWGQARRVVGTGINFGIPFLSLIPIQLGMLILAGISGFLSSLASKYLVDWSLIQKAKMLRARLLKEQILGKSKRVEHLQRELAQLTPRIFAQWISIMLYSSALAFPMLIWSWSQVELSIHLTQAQILEVMDSCLGIRIDLQNLTQLRECWDGPIQELEKLARACPLEDAQDLDECLSHGRIRLEPYLKLPLIGPRTLDHRAFGLIPYWLIWLSLCSMPFYGLSRRLLKLP